MPRASRRKVGGIICQVARPSNLFRAWLRVQANGGGAGVDGVSVRRFEQHVDAHLDRLQQEILAGRYQPKGLRVISVPKAGAPGQSRQLAVATVYDRVCQRALLQVIEPVFESLFDGASYGYRRERSSHLAVRRVGEAICAGSEWVVDADIRDFFGSVSHARLLVLLKRVIGDHSALELIQRILWAGVLPGAAAERHSHGLPLGGPLSPLLSNVLLTPFDREMRRHGFHLTRFADDWVVTCSTRSEAEVALNTAASILDRLGLELQKRKTRIVSVRDGLAFLGYRLRVGKDGRLVIYPSRRAVETLKARVRAVAQAFSGDAAGVLAAQVNSALWRWASHYRTAGARQFLRSVDRWLVHCLDERMAELQPCWLRQSVRRTRWHREEGLLSLSSLMAVSKYSETEG